MTPKSLPCNLTRAPATILESLMLYCGKFAQLIGHYFDTGVIRLTALTGAAATEIKGKTTAKACKLMPRQTIETDDIHAWKNTRMLIVDEISFGDHDHFLSKLSDNLQELTGCRDFPFGSIPVIFIGDFFQLAPIGGKPIYLKEDGVYWNQQINRLVELRGEWRFSNCSELRDIFREYRQLGLTSRIREKINSRVVTEAPDLPDAKICTYRNDTKERCNNTIFTNRLNELHSRDTSTQIPEDTIVVKGRVRWSHNNCDLKEKTLRNFLKYATEENTRQKSNKSKRVDPMLKLYAGCQVMLVENKDVDKGHANGTTAQFLSLQLKQRVQPHRITIEGFWVYAVYADEVEFIRLQWTADSTFEGTFTIKPQDIACVTKMEIRDFGIHKSIEAYVHIWQFAMSINNATTGHKLQGKTVEELIVAEWAPANIKNWIYVVLSRVKELKNLYLLQKLPNDTPDTAPDSQLIQMMTNLRRHLVPSDAQFVSRLRQRLQHLRPRRNTNNT